MNILRFISILTYYLGKININLFFTLNEDYTKCFISKNGVIFSKILIIIAFIVDFYVCIFLYIKIILPLIQGKVFQYVLTFNNLLLALIKLIVLIVQVYTHQNIIIIYNKLSNSIAIIQQCIEKSKQNILLNKQIRSIAIRKLITLFLTYFISIQHHLSYDLSILGDFNNYLFKYSKIYSNLTVTNILQLLSILFLLSANSLYNVNIYLENCLKNIKKIKNNLKNYNKNYSKYDKNLLNQQLKNIINIDLKQNFKKIFPIFSEINQILHQIICIFEFQIFLCILYLYSTCISCAYIFYEQLNIHIISYALLIEILIIFSDLYYILSSCEISEIQYKNAKNILMQIIIEIQHHQQEQHHQQQQQCDYNEIINDVMI